MFRAFFPLSGRLSDGMPLRLVGDIRAYPQPTPVRGAGWQLAMPSWGAARFVQIGGCGV
jgi:hypothetical protein